MSQPQSQIAFSPDNEAKFQDLLPKYPTRQAVIIPALALAQEQFGYLTPEVMDYVAHRLEQPAVAVYAVVEFYTMLFTKPVGKHHIQLCHTLTCTMRGCDALKDQLKDRLGVEPGEVTQDGLFSYEWVECLGACGHAPMMRMDKQYFNNLTEAKLDKIIQACRDGQDPAAVK